MSGDSLDDFFRKKQQEDGERMASQFMEQARNAMRAVRIAIQDGDDEEALRLIGEALGEGDDG